ncbi:hypothetical protein [Streptomyces sp. SID12501]|uniref:Tetracycline repressor TetR C-terminal domain-containing protein n=1 Tax=Streptomyces sp. SID12501 TaxID=2706042 RepID=A0A6B3BUK3_9ACTN|nr:hypothetical protein [Streptomyces sp. SID12501]NEC88045.1 hypothetical protein [Streptomyces sp. SID12501]
MAAASFSPGSAVCWAWVLASRSGVNPRPVILREALARRDPAEYQVLTRIAALPVTTYDDAQLDFSIDVFLAGAEAVLRGRGGPPPGTR